MHVTVISWCNDSAARAGAESAARAGAESAARASAEFANTFKAGIFGDVKI